MVVEEAAIWQAEPGAKVKYSERHPVEFLPWLCGRGLETRVLINDLVHSLGAGAGPVSPYWRRYLDQASAKPTAVDQYDAEGRLLARHRKVLAPNEIWRLSPEPAGASACPEADWTYGLMVFSGRRTLCHFQVVGDGTFAACHARRMPLDRPPKVQRRWVPFPRQRDIRLSLLLMNTGRDANRITITRVAKDGPRDLRWKGRTVEIPRLGCRLVNLNALLPAPDESRQQDHFLVESTHPYDFYTVIENGAASPTRLSIQHVK